jgi:acetyl-CoA carboxylase biotin carboxyl carrier protein
MATDVKAHITGTVWKIEAKPGSKVSEGDTVIILESMKMEMPVEAPCAGTITEIKIKEGEAVNEDQVLAVIAEE